MDSKKTPPPTTPLTHHSPPQSNPAPAQPNPAPALRAGQSLRACLFVLLAVMVLLAIDLGSKSWAFEHVASLPVHLTGNNADQPGIIGPHQAVQVVPKLLSLKLTLNRGAIFGLGQGNQLFFVIVGLVAIVIIGRLFWGSPAKAIWTHLALAAILAGALGNFYDRVCFSAVRDLFFLFPDTHLPFGWHWPGNGYQPGSDLLYPWIFNFADVCLMVGVGAMMLITWRTKPPASTSASGSTSTSASASPSPQNAQAKPD